MPIAFWIIWGASLVATTFIGTYVVRRWRDTYGWGILVTFLSAYLIVNTALASRTVTVPVFGLSLTLLSGSIIWPFTSQVVDMINEVYGGKKAYVAAALGYLGRLVFVCVALAAAQLSPVWDPAKEVWWQSYFGQLGRTVFAGAVAYGAVQFLNIYVFVKFKRQTMPNEHTLWQIVKGGFLRSWTGDIFAELVDSPIFYTLAFAGVMPWPLLGSLILSGIGTKIVMDQFNIPFYALFRILLGNSVEKEY